MLFCQKLVHVSEFKKYLMQSYAYKINLKSSDFFLHQNSNNQLKTLPKRYLNGAECINLIFIDTFYCISKTNTNAPIMEYMYMYINLRFKAKSAHVKSKTASLLKLYLTKSRDRVIFLLQ